MKNEEIKKHFMFELLFIPITFIGIYITINYLALGNLELILTFNELLYLYLLNSILILGAVSPLIYIFIIKIINYKTKKT